MVFKMYSDSVNDVVIKQQWRVIPISPLVKEVGPVPAYIRVITKLVNNIVSFIVKVIKSQHVKLVVLIILCITVGVFKQMTAHQNQ